MNTVTYIVVGLLGIAGSIVVASLAAWLQQRNWVHQNFEKRREDQKSSAQKIALEVAKALDRRLYRQRRFLWTLRSGDNAAIERARADYQKSLFEWNDNFGRFKAALWASFGDDARAEFEEDLHRRFASNGLELEGVYSGRLSASRLPQCARALDVLGQRNAAFVYRRLLNVRRDQVGDISKFSAVSQDNWHRLTSLFLLRRLFGLTQQR